MAFLRIGLTALTLLLVFYVTATIWLLYLGTRSPLEYEIVDPETITSGQLCPGEVLEFLVHARVRRAPAVLSVAENWMSKTEPRNTVTARALEWRIVPEPIEMTLAVKAFVPTGIRPGRYDYTRAVGLTNPVVIDVPVVIAPVAECEERKKKADVR